MKQAREFDPHSNPESEDREEVVDVVEHAMQSAYLRSQLSNHGRKEDHCQSASQKLFVRILENPQSSVSARGPVRQVNSEDSQNNHELPDQEVPIKVITLVGKRSVPVSSLVRGRMGLLAQLWVDGSKIDQ
jgi:hypothetical protein